MWFLNWTSSSLSVFKMEKKKKKRHLSQQAASLTHCGQWKPVLLEHTRRHVKGHGQVPFPDPQSPHGSHGWSSVLGP